MYMNTGNRSISVLLASALLLTFLSGCGLQEKGEAGSDVSGAGASTAPPATNVSSSPSVITAPQSSADPSSLEEEAKQVIIYSSDEEMQTMIEEKVMITPKDELDLINKTIAELQKDHENGGFSLWKDIHILSVELKDEILTLDVHIPDEARLGAPGELQLIETLKSTLFQFSFIEGIELLVAGEAVESLMGHVEIDHPIKKTE